LSVAAAEHALRQLRQAAEHSARLAAAAAGGDWDEVTRLEAERRPLLEAAFAAGAPHDAAAAADLIRQILDADRVVRELAGRARGVVAGELAALHRGRRMSKAYRDAEQ
jgi:hypothetical protein